MLLDKRQVNLGHALELRKRTFFSIRFIITGLGKPLLITRLKGRSNSNSDGYASITCDNRACTSRSSRYGHGGEPVRSPQIPLSGEQTGSTDVLCQLAERSQPGPSAIVGYPYVDRLYGNRSSVSRWMRRTIRTLQQPNQLLGFHTRLP